MVFTFQPPFFAGLSGYVAEMYSHLIARQLGLPEYIHDNSVAYIASWMKLCSPRHNSSNREVSIM